MVMKKKLLSLIVLMSALVLLSACAQTKLKVEPIDVSDDAVEQIARLEKEVDDAKEKQINVLSPTWYEKAQASLNLAKERLERGDERSDILEEINLGRAQLQRAEEISKISRTVFADVIQARQRAQAAGATALGSDYVNAEQQFLELTKAIEKDNLNWAQNNRTKVIRSFDNLELQAIKERAIGEARKLIIQAEKEGAVEIAPITFKVAQDELNKVDAYITANRYQENRIGELADQANFQARRLHQVIRHSEKIQTMQPEQITLWIEEMLYSTTTKPPHPDTRDQAFEAQVENIKTSISEIQEDNQKKIIRITAQQEEINDLKKRIAAFEAETRGEQLAKKSFEAERQFNQLIDKVRRQFGPREAEIYKQGTRLVIRLKSIEFPVGKAVITQNNYALLSRVQETIKAFTDPEVIIEGHTDSIGTDKLNEALSLQRAEAVRQYFIANGTSSPERVLVVGYGSKYPLASNATAEGRAINRRIDVLIAPPIKKYD
jgi:outer membrane protein OmpA-like peptidoglycan-associated protein